MIYLSIFLRETLIPNPNTHLGRRLTSKMGLLWLVHVWLVSVLLDLKLLKTEIASQVQGFLSPLFLQG